MKKLILPLILVFGTLVILAFSDKDKVKPIEIGSKAPKQEYKMPGVDGKDYSLKSSSGENGLLVVFTCNTCPFVVAWEDRYNDLYDLAKTKNIGMLLVNSNEAKRNGDDSMKAMKEHAKELGYKSPYVVDKKSGLADAFGARTTPHIFLFNNKMELVYRGAIDDNYKSKENVEQQFLMNALNKLEKGEKIDPNTTKAIGCSIKRVWSFAVENLLTEHRAFSPLFVP